MTKRKSRTPLNKEVASEDYCFFCKDGGELVICDYRDCLKAYHLTCIEKENPFLKSKQTLRCDWHYCRDCKKAPEFYCYFCPKAYCIHCILSSEFVNFKGKYGFCTMCLKVVLLWEEGKDVDSDGEKVDFEDYETREALFKEYYKNYKNQQKNESFSVDALRDAKERLVAGNNLLTHADPGEFDDDTEDGSLNSDSVSFDNNVMECKPTPKKKKLKSKPSSSSKHGGKSKGLQFCGWGSKPLVNFLKEMGADTEQKMSQFNVTSWVSKYVKDHNLQDPANKKNIGCDEKLRSIFGTKVVKINKIYALLGAHFAENREESSEEENSFENDDLVPDCSMRSGSKSVKARPKKEAQITTPPSATHASVSKNNINLVYLRRSVVQELSKHPSSFETKIIGCFVRVKVDPDDFWQKNSHQLVQVTGVKRATTTGDKSEICLCVKGMLKEISLSLLSDGDISEEEVEDLWQRIKEGQIQQPTVMELQKKADALHEDITKDWIVREVKKLTIQIDRANELGRRREMSEYLDKRSSLESPLEQSRLLETYPTVIPEAAAEEEAGNEGGNHEASPLSNDGTVTPEAVAVEEEAENVGVTHEASPLSNDGLNDKSPDNQTSEEDTPRQTDTYKVMNQTVKPETPSLAAKPLVIDLDSSDDEDTNNNQSSVTKDVAAPKNKDPEEQQWMVMGPDEKKRGPFPVSALKQLIAASSYALKVKVWKENQNEGDAITLEEAVRFAFQAS